MTDEALRQLKPRFNNLYAKKGRPSIAPEKLLRALLLQALYSVRSERLLMEQLDYNLLFRWFVGLNMDDSVTVEQCSSHARESPTFDPRNPPMPPAIMASRPFPRRQSISTAG